MKTKLFFLSVFLATFVACTSEEFELTSGQKSLTRVSTADLRVSVLPEEGGSMQDVFRVTRQEVEDYLAKTPMASGQMTVKSIRDISPVVYLGDTLGYFVRYAKGWTFHAADKRMAAVLAINYEDTGMDALAFVGRKAIEPWITEARNEINFLRTHVGYDSRSASLVDWARIDGRMRVSPENTTDLIWVRDEIISSETVTHPHFMSTAWHQESPFDAYTPYQSVNSTVHCPAGCVAVALGQFLYHMHTAHGFVMQTPASGSCTGTWQNYTQNFWNMTDTLFSQMALSDDYYTYGSSQFDKVALMLGYIGKGVHMQYRASGSSTNTSNVLSFMSSIGMAVNYGELTLDNLQQNVETGYPVILIASNSNNERHMWVCDGYKYDHEVYDAVYAHRTDTALNHWMDEEENWIRIRRERDTNYFYQMNWGENLWAEPWMSDVDITYYHVFETWRDFDRNRYRISVL